MLNLRGTFVRRAMFAASTSATLGVAVHAGAITIGSAEVAELYHGNIVHCDAAVATHEFDEVFECGDELFGTVFNALDGVGINVGDGKRFSHVPRADMNGNMQWNKNIPPRVTGPNGQACEECHSVPIGDGAGFNNSNVIRDPLHAGTAHRFIERNTPPVLALAGLQRLAEEINMELLNDEAAAKGDACALRRTVTRNLDAKGIHYGTVTAVYQANAPRCPMSVSRMLSGIDSDLRPKPFQWKGVEPTIRSFNRGAAHNELGMQPVELTGDNVDGDGDGVRNEFTVADMTALAVYLAAQPRPVTLIELDLLRQTLNGMGTPGRNKAFALGLPTLTAAQKNAIANGSNKFVQAQCATCHKPTLLVDLPIFREPSLNPNYRDKTFPAGQNPVARGVDPARPISFDMRVDPPDNVIEVSGVVVA